MARILKSKCRVCRREGIKLFLKGSKCDTAKCTLEKNSQPPGQHGAKRPRFTDYGKHLRETQKLKRLYGLTRKQLKRYFGTASKQTGNTGENLLVLLETRLDNIVFLGGFTPSRSAARQLIDHGHVFLNNRKATIPSMNVKSGDIIKPANNETSLNIVKKHTEKSKKDQIPSWIKLVEDPMQMQMLQKPKRTDISTQINEQLVVEFCSR
jgi:small subunit ribosomal protein S4